MSRQKKRTTKKYNRSQRKNNTRRKTHKKRVRKTHKKRTHKRMKGGSLQEGLTSGGDTRSLTQKITQGTREATQSLGSKVQNFLTPGNGDVEPLSSGYLPSPEPIQPPAAQLPSPPPPAAPSSNPSKNKEILKHVASGLGGAAIYSNPMAALGTAAGVAGAVGAYKLGQIGYRGIGSAKDKLKSKALIKNIEQCLKILVNYAVIGDSGREAILQRLKKNSGYFGIDGKGPGPKITIKGEERRGQKTMKKDQEVKNEEYKQSGDLLNVGETPVVQVPSLEVPSVTMATPVNTASAGDTTVTATPQVDLLTMSTPQVAQTPSVTGSAFDFIHDKTAPAGAGFNLTQ